MLFKRLSLQVIVFADRIFASASCDLLSTVMLILGMKILHWRIDRVIHCFTQIAEEPVHDTIRNFFLF